MTEKPFLPDNLIVDCLKSDYGIDAIAVTFLPIGADINASVYRADSSGQSSYFVKLKRGHHNDLSVEIVELLHDAGIQQVIPPLKTISGQSTARIKDFILIVYPFVKGQDGFTRSLTDIQWVELGNALKQIHEIVVPPSTQNHLRKEVYSPKWRKSVRELYDCIDASTPASDEIGFKLSKFMKENRGVIQRLVDRSEQLCQKLQDESPEFVLCHSDIHGGNVLIDGKGAIYIVDWDDPIMAPKERDLMFIGGGVANVWNKPHEEKAFYKGYGKTEINMTILAYYRHERIVEDIAVYGQALILTMSGGENRSVMYKDFMGMFEPRGVVEIAFESDVPFVEKNESVE